MEYDDLKQVMRKISSSKKSESESEDLSNSNYWSLIPEDILIKIFKSITVKDILNCSETCRRWNFIAQDSLLWKYKFQSDFKVRKKISRKPGKQKLSNCLNYFRYRNQYQLLIA
jgi:F-box-like